MGASYSKRSVDRAGRQVVEYLRDAAEGRSPGQPYRRDASDDPWQVIDWWRSKHAVPLALMRATLSQYALLHREATVTERLKRVSAIASKLMREQTMKLSRMADIGGVRAVVRDQDSAYELADRLNADGRILRVRDYVIAPKTDGYRALHLINRIQGRLIEVQLRTPEQDAWASLVERLSRTIAPDLKFDGGPQWLRAELREVADRNPALLAPGSAVRQLEARLEERFKLQSWNTDEI